MSVWQVDFYRRPLQDLQGNPLWELLICDEQMAFTYAEVCAQQEASAAWLKQQFSIAKDRSSGQWPTEIQIFRPQTLTLVEVACRELPISVQPMRSTSTLKQWLRQRAVWYPTLTNYVNEPYAPLAIDRPAPVPVADYLMGDRWQFAAISPTDLQRFAHEPMPVCDLPAALMPLSLGLPSTQLIPGVIIDGGRQSMALVQWLVSARPVMLQYIAGAPDGLLLEAGLSDRWIMATFEDDEVAGAARTFTERKLAAQGLHFLLVRPDDSGMTYTGLWLLQQTGEKQIQPVEPVS